MWGWIVSDSNGYLSEIKLAHHAINRKDEINEVFTSISSMFISTVDIDSAIDFALSQISKISGCSRSYIFLFRKDLVTMDNTHEYCSEGVSSQKEHLQDIPSSMFPWWMNNLRSNKIIHITDVSALPKEASAEKENLEMQGIKSLIVLPLYTHTVLAGFIGLDDVFSVGEWDKKDVEYLRMLSNIVGSGLERKMIEDEKRAIEKKLKRSEKQYHDLFSNAITGFALHKIITNDAGEPIDYIFLKVNNSFEVLTGLKREDIIGKRVTEVLPGIEKTSFIEKYGDVAINSNVMRFEQFSENLDRFYDISVYSPEEGYFATIFSDITESKKAEQLLRSSKLLAENANQIKTEFIMNMHHEVRTPLNSIIGFSDILLGQADKFDEKQLKYLKNIHSNGNHLLEIFNEIITISKIEKDDVDLEVYPVAILTLIEKIERAFKTFSSEKSIVIKHKINDNISTVIADESKLYHILYNLVHNALKFSDGVGIIMVDVGEDGNNIRISVKDEGIGISIQDQDKMFDYFTQIDSSTTRNYGGIGLGLTVVRKFVELHNGKIWAESEVGVGSTFTFTIPVNGNLQ